jgi:hypothetical protein
VSYDEAVTARADRTVTLFDGQLEQSSQAALCAP